MNMRCQACRILSVCLAIQLLAGCRPRIDSPDFEERMRAVARITDQTHLAKIALEDPHLSVQVAAIARLTDREVLERIASHQNAGLGRAALDRISDESALSRIAIADADGFIGGEALLRVNEQDLLARVALEAKSEKVRLQAAGNLRDEALLARVAIETRDAPVGEAAARRLSDEGLQTKVAVEGSLGSSRTAAVYGLRGRLPVDTDLLARIAVEDEDWQVRLSAVGGLKDKALLERIALKDRDWRVRAHVFRDAAPEDYLRLLWAASDTDPVLKELAGDLANTTEIARESIARMRLAAGEPRIRERIPGIAFDAQISEIEQAYVRLHINPNKELKRGESVTFMFHQNGKTLVSKNWKTDFPTETFTVAFLPAVLEGGEFLAELMQLPCFSQEDLLELCRSQIPEARHGAVLNLKDQTMLLQIALGDSDQLVRTAALKSLVDPTALARAAIESKDQSVRRSAVKKLTDQSQLARIAVEAGEWDARLDAVGKLTDVDLLGRIAIEDKDESVRHEADSRIRALKETK